MQRELTVMDRVVVGKILKKEIRSFIKRYYEYSQVYDIVETDKPWLFRNIMQGKSKVYEEMVPLIEECVKQAQENAKQARKEEISIGAA